MLLYLENIVVLSGYFVPEKRVFIVHGRGDVDELAGVRVYKVDSLTNKILEKYSIKFKHFLSVLLWFYV